MTLPPFRGRALADQLERLALAADCPADLEAVCAAEPEEVARSAPTVRVRWVLEEIQRRHGYLPERYLRHAALRLGLSRGAVFQVALGDDSFRFSPPAGRRLSVCVGPSCLGRGSAELLRAAEDAVASLNAPPPAESESTFNASASTAAQGGCTSVCVDGAKPDGDAACSDPGPVSVQTVRCFGMCRSAPVFQLNGVPFPHATAETLRNALLGSGGAGEGGVAS